MAKSVYLAAPWELRSLAQQYREHLGAAGITCTSRWLTEDSSELNDEWARKDLEDVRSADALLALNSEEFKRAGSGGRHVEFSYALALGKPIWLIGVRSHIFHHLTEIHVVPDLAAAIVELTRWEG